MERADSFYNKIYLTRVPIRKEVTINFLEFFHRKVATWAIFKESFVPFLNFGIYSVIWEKRKTNEREENHIKNNKQNEKRTLN